MSKNKAQTNLQPRREDIRSLIAATTYRRYLLLKGVSVEEVASKIKEYGFVEDLKARAIPYKEWLLLDLTEMDINGNIQMYYHLVGFFLEYDPMPATSIGVGISYDVEGKNSYIVYFDHLLDARNNAEMLITQDCNMARMHGIFFNNQKFIPSLCFDEILDTTGFDVPDFDVLMNRLNINVNEIEEKAKEATLI